MIYLDGNSRDVFINSIINSTDIDQVQLVKLQVEFTMDPLSLGYAGKTDKEVFALFCLPQARPNPETRKKLLYTSLVPADVIKHLKKLVVGTISAWQHINKLANGGDAVSWEALDTIRTYDSRGEKIPADNPELVAMMNAMNASKAVENSEWNKLLKYSDPNWQETIYVVRADEVLGSDMVPTSLEEIRTARS